CLLGILNPANEFIAGDGRQAFPKINSTFARAQGAGEIGRHFMYETTRDIGHKFGPVRCMDRCGHVLEGFYKISCRSRVPAESNIPGAYTTSEDWRSLSHTDPASRGSAGKIHPASRTQPSTHIHQHASFRESSTNNPCA